MAASKAVSPMSGSDSRLLFRHEVLGKYQADYYYDEQIGYIFVQEPHWLDEAYSEAISPMDTGILASGIGPLRAANISVSFHGALCDGWQNGWRCGFGILK